MKGRKLFASVLAAALFGGMAGITAQAESGYYKWVDQYGNSTHSDRPPPAGVEYEFISTDTGLKRRVTAEESRSEAESGTSSVTPSAPPQQTAAASTPPAPEKNPNLCAQAKSNLHSLDTTAMIRMKDPDGTTRYLTEEEKEVQREKARDLITRHCEDA